MAYPQFPDIESYSYQEEITTEEIGIGHEPEDGMEITRPQYSRTRETYSRHWNAMSDSDFIAFKNFYSNVIKGKSMIFTWDGINGRIIKPYTARRVSVNPILWSVEVAFREA